MVDTASCVQMIYGDGAIQRVMVMSNVRGRGYDKAIRKRGKETVRIKHVRDNLKESMDNYKANYDHIFRKKAEDDKA